MKDSAGSILLKYFGIVAILFSLLGYSIYTTLRRSKVSMKAVSTCVTTTAVIATSVNKLSILLMNPVVTEASTNIGSIP